MQKRRGKHVTYGIWWETDEKLYKKSIYKEGYEDGHELGVSEGCERGVDEGHKRGIMPDDKAVALIAENYSVYKEEILNLLKEDK